MITLMRLLGLSAAIYFLSSFPGYASQPDSSRNKQSAFDPETAQWNIAWPGRLSQYDLVYKSPPIDPLEGIALGNGEIGALFWCEDSKIIAVVNKSDLWDDATFGRFTNWKIEEEDYSSTKRHACRIIIDLKFPVFSTLYLTDFNAKLNLADASLSIEASSSFGKVSLKAFVDHKSGVLLYDLESDMNEDVPVDIVVERYGSRSYSHWYHQINRDASIGLSGTEVIADKEGVFITQDLSSGTFAVGGRVIGNKDLTVDYTREHSRSAVINLSGNREKNAQLAFAVTSPGNGDPIIEVKPMLSSASEIGIEHFWQSHTEAWKSIWDCSFMDYGDDYLTNLWYLTIYYTNASQGGKYPGRFINGLWGFTRDVQNWNFYFHWNQQTLYWPLNAAGYHDLVKPYLDFRFNSLPHAKKDAKEFFNAQGAFISDVVDRRGYNSVNELHNHTPVAEIALEFWRQYQYTGDKEFLMEKALPFMLEATRFFESLLVKEDDGFYHSKESTGYEGWVFLKDGLTDMVYARALFTTTQKALKEAQIVLPETKKWNEIAKNLAPIPTVKADERLIDVDESGYTLNHGIFMGETSPTNEIMSLGWGIEEEKWLNRFIPCNDTVNNVEATDSLKSQEGVFGTVESSPVFPSGLIGLSQQNSKIFNAMKATTLLNGLEGSGFDPAQIVMARLGMSDELAVDLEHFPGRFQIYHNGWGHWATPLSKEIAESIFRTNLVKDAASPEAEKFPFYEWPFRYNSMESMSVLATVMNESLLQSYDGILRIAPAIPANKNGRFTLHAVGGFVVSAEIRSGAVQWICIRSLLGNPCKLEIPWEKAVVTSNLKRKSGMLSENIPEIKTRVNEIIMIFPEGQYPESWAVIQENPLVNEKVKYHSSGKAQLGIPRMY